MHGQIRVRLREFGGQFVGEGAVDAFPEAVAAPERGVDVGAREVSPWLAFGEFVLDLCGQARVEGSEAVDCSRDAVEADAFEADFAH